MVRLRSSEGVSATTLFLTVVYVSCNVGSASIVKWRQIESCRTRGFGCLGQLLDLLQLFLSMVAWQVLFVPFVSYPPHNRALYRWVGLAAAALLVAVLASALGLSFYMPCGHTAIGWSKFLSSAGSICAAVCFVPQLVETWRIRGSGSLSYLTYLLCISGAAGIVVNQMVFNHDPWSVWMPMLVSLVMQSSVFLSAVVFDVRKWRLVTRQPPAPPPDVQEGPFSGPLPVVTANTLNARLIDTDSLRSSSASG